MTCKPTDDMSSG